MAAGRRVKIVEELVSPWVERPDEHGDLLSGGHHLLAVQLGAFKFGGHRIGVADHQLDLDPSGDRQLVRHELVVLERNRKARDVGAGGSCDGEGDDYPSPGEATHRALHKIANAN